MNLNKLNLIYCLILGILPLLSLLWSLDRGVFIFVVYFPFFVILLVNKKIKEVFLITLFCISSIVSFTLNGTSNSQSYIGKPNYVISKPPTSSNNAAYCRQVDNTPKTSVKSYSAYLKSKSHSGPVDSLKCYKELNSYINSYFFNN